MSKGTKDMLKKIISNQELIMKHLKISIPVTEKKQPKATVRKKATKRKAEKKAPAKKR